MITGDQIRQAREAAGLTQGQLADRLNVTLRTVGNWERSTTLPTQRQGLIASVLGPYLGDQRTTDLPFKGVSDVELLAEIARRFARGNEQEAGGEHVRSAPMNELDEKRRGLDDALRRERIAEEPEDAAAMRRDDWQQSDDDPTTEGD